MNPFEKLALELKRLQTGYREESYYRSLCEFLEAYGSDKEYLHMLNITATSNPNSDSIGEGIGFPDIEVRRNRRLVGYIEVKAPNENLDNPAYVIQFNKYKESLENVVFTNFKKWILYTWDKDGKPQKTAEAEWDQKELDAKDLKKLLTIFFEGQSYQAKTPHQLALALARKTKLLSSQVEEAIIKDNPEKRLVDLKNTFEKTLIQDISDHQFSNIFAETITYSLFLAMLQHFERGSSEEFTLRTAVDYLPKSVPIFKDLYQLTGGTVEPITPEIYKATEILIEQLNFADIEKIYKKLVDHKPGEDPVIQFYEPFLAEYDPKEREARGVYYTPKPVVDYIVRSVDYILKNIFNKPEGLGNGSVQILDPAAGTGTFLMSIIQNIHADIEKTNKPLGGDLVKRKFNDVVSSHILKHLYGFELLIAPYAIAHLKLTLELERLGFEFSMTENDKDIDNDRLKIYLANTLDDPEKPPINLFGFESITEESEKARLVKKDAPILVIIGNPPYSGHSSNKGQWISNLLHGEGIPGEELSSNYFEVDGSKLEERNTKWLNDDYVKFIRFAQWKIEKNGEGIIAFITNHAWLDNPTFRGMRQKILQVFNQVYIYDLHGNTKKRETAPNGGKDENVFKIQQGVSIFFLFKQKNDQNHKVMHANLFGRSQYKYQILSENNLQSTEWQEIVPYSPQYLLSPITKDIEYDSWWSINDIFLNKVIGIYTARDDLTIDFQRDDLLNKIKSYAEGDLKEVVKETNDFNPTIARQELRNSFAQDKALSVLYRPFDYRWIYYDGSVVQRTRRSLMENLISMRNIALLVGRSSEGVGPGEWDIALVTNRLVDLNVYRRGGEQVYPLIIEAPKSNGSLGLDIEGSNFNLKYIEIFHNYAPKATELEIFTYIYAILYSVKYRNKYKEFLRRDFPRIPWPKNNDQFMSVSRLGMDLINLHLLGENPFDNSETIFSNTSKWGVSIGGEKPIDIEDWKVTEVRYDEKTKRVYVNPGQYFEGVEKDVWKFMVGGYQVLEKWLKDRKKAERVLSSDDQIHYMKIVVSLRETIRIMKEIDEAIPEWPMK